MTIHQVVRQAEGATQGSHLVLEQQTQRLDQLEVHSLRQATDVVVGLDHLRPVPGRGALDHVGIEGALGQELHRTVPARFLLEHRDELGPDDPPLALGVRHAGEPVEEARPRVLHGELEPALLAQLARDLFGLA